MEKHASTKHQVLKIMFTWYLSPILNYQNSKKFILFGCFFIVKRFLSVQRKLVTSRFHR